MIAKKHPQDAIMSQIIAARFTDPDRALSLCRSLLSWSEAEGDRYAKVFALTYMGDYYVGKNDIERAGEPLGQALKHMGDSHAFDTVKLRTCNLLAIYYEMRADEQSSTQYYLEALSIARKIEDTDTECVVLNNLGFAFMRHKRCTEALGYFEQAYTLQQKSPETPLRLLLLTNLFEVSVALKQMDKAHQYLLACTQIALDPTSRDCHLARSWCYYYTALGDGAQASEWAGRALLMADNYLLDRMSAFENFCQLCRSMIQVGNQAYAAQFLQRLDQVSEGENLEQLQVLEELQVAYARAFAPAPELARAYRRYYVKTRQLQKRANQAISSAMKNQISLSEALVKKENLLHQKEQLEMRANTDELTGLFNRRYLEKALKEAAGPDGGALAIIMLDVDYFKEYNDFYGHQLGDSALQTVADCLMAHRVPGIFPCRFGGDEFTCLCRGLSWQQVTDYICALRADLAECRVPHEKSVCAGWLTLSIGYASWPANTLADPYLLLQQADRALYEAKQAGRNTYIGKQDALI